MIMYSFQAQMPTTSSLFSAYASLSALAMLLRSIFREFIPHPIRNYILSLLHHLFHRGPSHLTLVVEEVNSNGIGRNEIYDAAEVYLATKLTTPSTDRLKISKSPKDKSLTIRFEKGEQIDDFFDNVPLSWRFLSTDPENRRSSSASPDDGNGLRSSILPETRYFELSFDKKSKDKIINSYLPHILSKTKSMKEKERTLKLCTLTSRYNGGNVFWDTINLDHPSTFDTIAIDPDVKSGIIEDLDRFVRRKDFYRRVGRAWKRGYLLYGPPGTGKSSLVAAMANYLRFDIYDLQLGNLIKDSDLRRLLLATANRSILVIEDIDCTIDIKNRRNQASSGSSSPDENGQLSNYKPPEVQLTLSGLLNFIDGLWSSCGDERIIVFTTNHKEKLDPALLRPGRMDMHIHMSYLTFPSFRILVSNYLEFGGQHELFEEIESLIEVVKVTPAHVAEELMRSEDVNEALDGVLKLLRRKKEMMDNEDEVIKFEEEDDITIDEICLPTQNIED